MMNKAFLSWIFLFITSTCTFSQTKKDADFYYQNFEYRIASQMWEKEAENSKLSRQIEEKLLVCYLYTEQSTKGLNLIEKLQIAKEDNSLSFFAAQFCFQKGLYDRALEEAKKSRLDDPNGLPVLFEENCKFSKNSIRSLDGNIAQNQKNTHRAEILYKCGENDILLRESALDSMLKNTKESANFEEVFFLHPHIRVNEEWQEWNAISVQHPFWSMTSIQIDSKNKIAYFSVIKPLEPLRENSRSKMYQAVFNGFNDSLTSIKPLETGFDLSTCSSGHVALTDDGRFMVLSVFSDTSSSSNLFLFERKENLWSNMKYIHEVNTLGDELYPLFIDDNNFRFSSNGRPGYGNLDAFQMTFNKGEFTDLIQIQQPINSTADDFLVYGELYDSLTFSSNRGIGIGDDDVWNYFPKEKIIDVVVIPETKVKIEPHIQPEISFNPQRIYFDYNIASSEQTIQQINELKILLDANPSKMVILTGNTDVRGTNEYNEQLALQRAVFVKNELVKAGIDQAKIRTVSEGERLAALKKHTKEVEFKKDRFVSIELSKNQ